MARGRSAEWTQRSLLVCDSDRNKWNLFLLVLVKLQGNFTFTHILHTAPVNNVDSPFEDAEFKSFMRGRPCAFLTVQLSSFANFTNEWLDLYSSLSSSLPDGQLGGPKWWVHRLGWTVSDLHATLFYGWTKDCWLSRLWSRLALCRVDGGSSPSDD